MIDDSSILRCGVASCNKKLSLTNNFECECKQFFCVKHKFSLDHNCTFDYKNKQREILQKSLQKITKDKVIKI